MKFFGPENIAPSSFDLIATPVGSPCLHCEEPILVGECGYSMPYISQDATTEAYFHEECHLRTLYGSVAHIQRRCSCFVVGASETDDPGLTKREAAKAAVMAFAGAWSRRHWK